MPRRALTPQPRRFLAVPDVPCSATILRQTLLQAFAVNPRLAASVLDDQGHLRANVAVFIDGRRCTDRIALDDALAAPAYPPQPDGAPGPAWTPGRVWALEAVHGTWWAGTLPGGLFRSADAGRSWQRVTARWEVPEPARWAGGGVDVPGLHSICPHPGKPRELLVGVSCGGAWTTRDDGAVQDPHRIVRCAGQPAVLWCQHHCGIWRSRDNGATWQRITAPLSSFAGRRARAACARNHAAAAGAGPASALPPN